MVLLDHRRVTITGAAKPDIVVLIRRSVIQVECECPSVGAIIPIAAAKEHPAAFCDFSLNLTILPSSTQKASC